MQLTFASITLVDSDADPRIAGVIEALWGESLVDTVPGYNQANPGEYTRGNVRGQFVIRADCSYNSEGDAAAAYAAAHGLLDTQDDAVLEYGTTSLTMANAILRKVERVLWDGVQLILRYTFEITTVVNT